MPAATLEPFLNEDAVRAVHAITGGDLRVGAYGPEIDFDEPAAGRRGALAVLPDHGLLQIGGADAVKFLHSQLTNDLEHLPEGEAQWTGYCTAKGRLLATALAWRDASNVWLMVSRPLAHALRKRLSMYVLRSKASVEDVSDRFVVLGAIGVEPGAVLGGAASAVSLAVPGAMRVGSAGGATAIGLPARALIVVPSASLADWWTRLASDLAPVSTSWWRRAEALSGVPRIVAATSEAFVPQMVNFEVVGGVSFKKGCYPGQEVVARSQYLGKLKRRMFAGHLRGGPEPLPGQDVDRVAGGEPVGSVVLAAPSATAAGGWDVLFESQTAAVDEAGLRIGDAPLEIRPLPYQMP